MSRSALRVLWDALTKPREPIVPGIVRRRSVRRRLAGGPQPLCTDRDYDHAIRDYLAIWLEPPTTVSHHERARLHFGLEKEVAEYVEQLLWSAAFRGLRNWVNCHDDPWWQAAWRYSQSFDRSLLDRLRWLATRRG